MSLLASAPTAAYLHIPFCRRRCYYCDFPVYVLGDRQRGESSRMVQTYVEVLEQEIKLSSGPPLQTIFFGGGTPSLLDPQQLDRLLVCLTKQFGIASNAEISMEIDPGTFQLSQLQAYQKAGINRVSMGLQAWQDELLALCGRSHRVNEIEQSLGLIQMSGIENWSVDLISGLPQQTMADWIASLERTIAYHPPHVSLYDLILEAGTPFAKQYQPNHTPLPQDDAEMYRVAQQMLVAAGYEHYEISNYAQPGQSCRHNQVYWQNQPYYGFGMGAASYLNGTRFTRPRRSQDYFQWVADGATCPQVPLSELDQLLETLMLGLRTVQGLKIAPLIQTFGFDRWQQVYSHLLPHIPHWVEVELGDQGWLRLTDPEGFLYSNVVLADLFTLGA